MADLLALDTLTPMIDKGTASTMAATNRSFILLWLDVLR